MHHAIFDIFSFVIYVNVWNPEPGLIVLGFRSYQTKSAFINGASCQIQQEELLF
jgi:hypothetical protein